MPKDFTKDRRKLTDDDQHIWHRVARTVRPLHMPKSNVPTATHVHIPPAPPPILHHSPQDIQTRSDKKVRRGQVHIDLTIDLHDLTRDAAFAALVPKIERAFKRRHRTVLVITGKGANLQGVLRQSLPSWLADVALRPYISATSPAHIRHGGSGAFYVFLKRRP